MKTVAKLKQQIEFERDYAKKNKMWGEKWMNFANDLQSKLDLALERLQTIAEGRYYESERSDSTTQPNVTAAIGLKKIARMQERKP